MLIDAHTHIFPRIHGRIKSGPTRELAYGRVAIAENVIQALPPIIESAHHTPEMLIASLDWASVDRAILLQGPFYGECNQYVCEAVQKYPDRLIGAAYFDPWEVGDKKEFERIFSRSTFRTLKLEFSEATGLSGLHPQARLDDPEIAWLWDELEARKIVLVIDMGEIGSRSYQTRELRTIAESHLGLRIVIPHLAQPNPKAEAYSRLWKLWQEQIDLGRLPNVWFDTASLPAYAVGEDFPFPTAEKYLHMALDRIGPNKVMWGTDIPALWIHATYKQLAKMAVLHVQHLSASDQELVLARNAQQIFGVT